MAPRRRAKEGQGASPPAAVSDRLSALPDELLHHVMSFLPAEDAVCTCVLARRWKDLWKSATCLQIERDLERDSVCMEAALEFVDHLLIQRANTPIDTCTLSLFAESDLSEEIPRFKLWIRHILKCKARVLMISIERTYLDGLKLISNHLEILHLSNIIMDDVLVDFSGCPALKELRIYDCGLHYWVSTISSQSLRRLQISDCVHDEGCCIRIDTPNLNSLHLNICHGRTPLLQRMPSLLEAFVNIEYCYGIEGATDNCLLLQSLSEAQNLVLSSDVKMFIFRRDLKWHTTFSNLKTLLLNESWCVPDDFSPLAYMIEHSPVLEKLTLNLYFEESRLHTVQTPALLMEHGD